MAMESDLERRLAREIEGEVLFDRFSRGRYATDASVYQMMPIGVVIPKTFADVEATLAIAREAGVAVLPRGGGTSQCGQTVNEAIVIDFTKHLNTIVEVDPESRTAVVEPGLVLDHLNSALKDHGLWFPVDVSTASRATLGGMAANNSCGARSFRYGIMRDNVAAIDALLADGTQARFSDVPRDISGLNAPDDTQQLFRELLDLGVREADEIKARFPDLMRRVGGYNLDALVPNGQTNNMAELLVGSEGTLAISRQLTLKLSPVLRRKTIGICHFPTFYEAMDATRHLVDLGPTAIELVDSTMIALGRAIPMFKPVVDEFVRGNPAALLTVEFAEDDQNENLRRLAALHERMAELGYKWGDPGKKEGGVVDAIDPAFQTRIMEFRKQGLNIMMSMKSAGKPISFIEDCAVRLEDLAEYTDRLTAIFSKYGTEGTWYAHASVGTLHVRPVLNLKLDQDVKKMRAIAEEAFEMVRAYKGSHSGEHGDGIARSEFNEPMFGARMARSFEWVKDRFDPEGVLNPGKVVRAPKMDDRSLMRFAPDYSVPEFKTSFDWSEYSGNAGGFQGAVEMCNNNGACRKIAGDVMCPSYRVTRNERDLTRGRANTLRLAISDQLGPDAFTSDEMAETMSLCVSCKGCRRECPTGVDMAKMKIEVLAARVRKKGLGLRARLVAYLPRYAPYAAKVPWLLNLRDRIPGLAYLSEKIAGFASGRALPVWRSDWVRQPVEQPQTPDVILFADTFNRYFEPDNLRAAQTVLTRAGFTVGQAIAGPGERPLCCGRTFLSAGLVEEAKAEMRRTIASLAPALERGATVVGLEPSCVLTFRDEAPALLGADWKPEYAEQFVLFEEFIDAQRMAGKLTLPLAPLPQKSALVHGHCHQKAFNTMGALQRTLAAVPELKIEVIASSCCGMAGSFGYQAETLAVSRAMGELSLLPKVRAADTDTLIIAGGTSCRHQIEDGTPRKAVHVARILCESSDLALHQAAD
ncbi:FAD-binding and (Fe-S)-binding domain-containing protein [Breoghania sp. L-A4]|uniref:FAD-binding and (Fe-S)-binding domain-containing protein n=1 Tax=Breoghania sp. L-A4 TaxID=2304600 RepID=UPI000E358AA9|nr:FAD-binding and (Fe-S)-binding domain-containing protein [Breoghania sp. L-A4]AXS41414.1 FAD-binding oxidoreductase [Breoghania sp. L-A4]